MEKTHKKQYTLEQLVNFLKTREGQNCVIYKAVKKGLLTSETYLVVADEFDRQKNNCSNEHLIKEAILEKNLKKRLELHENAKDYLTAARLCEHIDSAGYDKRAMLNYEKSGELKDASRLAQRTGLYELARVYHLLTNLLER